MVGTKLFIGNLPDTVNKDELEAMFKKFGKVTEFDILKDYGFVHYEQESEAKAAVEAMDGQIHRGSNIRVEVSRSAVRQKPGMGGKGECYRCGAEGHWSKECPRGPSRSRGSGAGRRRDTDRYSPYDRDPYYPPPPDPYDYYARSRGIPPHPYDRYRMAYERSSYPPLPPMPRDKYPPAAPRESLYKDYTDRADTDYYRRPSPPRDPYYDYYERRRLAAMGPYGDIVRSSRASVEADDIPSISREPLRSRVPGPY